MITADSITEDQIRSVREHASKIRDVTLHGFACDALGLGVCRAEDRPASIRAGREQCAAYLRAERSKSDTPGA